MAYADLHVHSIYSDGTMSPEQLVARAAENGVSLLAVADHDVIAGSLAATEPARKAGIRLIPAVEIDSFEGGVDYHILCYGADFSCETLMNVVRDGRRRMDKMSEDLLLCMQADYPQLDMAEYLAFPHDTDLGGWKMLQYLMHKGITNSLREGMPLYGRYGVTYEAAGFCPTAQVIEAIHAAGGRAVLAHPGEVIPFESEAQFTARLEALIALGLDGIECHYPSHSDKITRICREICLSRGLMITAGSDCHGSFGRTCTDVGETKTEIGELVLGGL